MVRDRIVNCELQIMSWTKLLYGKLLILKVHWKCSIISFQIDPSPQVECVSYNVLLTVGAIHQEIFEDALNMVTSKELQSET